jgi:hypothetical protein
VSKSQIRKFAKSFQTKNQKGKQKRKEKGIRERKRASGAESGL